MSTQLIPAVDLIDGKVVRLVKGDYEQKKVYSFDALKKLEEYENMGAKILHLVDLDGAKNPAKRQLKLIEKIASNINVTLQVGGGIRSIQDVRNLLDAGVSRVIVGSLAIKDPDLCVKILQHFSNENIVLALDVFPKDDDFFVTAHAWQEVSDKKLLSVLEFYAPHGLKYLLCTDISRDGTMQGANTRLYHLINEIFSHLYIQASGGVNNLENLAKLKGICSGVIVGKALLDGSFSVKDGIRVLL
ncbi:MULTISPECIES: 1-(5-phosphoribosyl)-5-[(5-phosphoribosylamino)methylideneamino]imidazole-4-carboxamide isomerase [unclassified Campylobacter]|uniref:1-(5-phosphoribosyl)-5-[(5- phosphoribosylamino)methylideneamino]imidazole-4- carboxamide isomerase n=1 Tax=unclassified Campylobacter TaxID=2593542 RepID=UPI00123836A8|nr:MULTISPECIES: 1-(5-phosphoribosyl)-5-[(5-phosphoribosylamino)methylideneamino]imidazole-4-carboxamide isomerase [unclassified Campylobacter]KAA6226049.1 1-(5-phosphoribosyl)-5-[(5-phosphoribosylamino)methylideneamino]imidazole-4-carboxamide isomerase [Campylobacter sp. LR196d]KAA6226642.1 1-(5-phosphoribosyl)-5-[(5-phosphoribosylamino)methylideneamino]imidazole-4-carboxamide isomerase [Campylobacter sp. LR286c]KAA6227572.1 1-(5-phosphoribosyl)-5-[(5-phosphoribosylamino)methylideneamino]imidaz